MHIDTYQADLLPAHEVTEFHEFAYVPPGQSEAILILETDDFQVWNDFNQKPLEFDSLVAIRPGGRRPLNIRRTYESQSWIIDYVPPCPADCDCRTCLDERAEADAVIGCCTTALQ